MNVVFSGDWKYMSRNPASLLATRKAGEGPEELMASVRVWATLNAQNSKARIP